MRARSAARGGRRPASVPALLLALALLPGCDAVRDRVVGWVMGGADAAASGEAPEGWDSIEGSARRLYYQFVDARGQVRFVERLDEVPEERREGVGFVKLDVPPPLSPADARQARATQISRGVVRASTGSAATREPRIVMYSADWCGACRKAKKYLNEKGVRFEIRDVDDPAAAAELQAKTGRRSIPVIDVDGRILTGFSPKAIDALIAGA